ncbi:carboxylating nicotinate-nucleotide diphosphorylase [Vacuolonema iberomarrocanum]|uniref:carboxylating nicotinate-nucleotide diphosphorylase n=1 Tax=Vacuolonema iberomarrocanum TaxID=3454632 RepID=UPI003F6DACA8
MKRMQAVSGGVISSLLLDEWIKEWLVEDIGRGDRTTEALLLEERMGGAQWVCKEAGIIAGLTIAARVFQLLSPDLVFIPLVEEGAMCGAGQTIATLEGSLAALLTGERVALNMAMHLSGVATLTRQYVEQIRDLPTQLVDTRKTTPGFRALEKYGTRIGGAMNHRMGLDDAVMLKENHIAAAGGIGKAIAQVRRTVPYPLSIEVETESLEQVEEAIAHQADIIMLDNMPSVEMRSAVEMIRAANPQIKIEASGNITLKTIRAIAEIGMDYISTSAPITRSTWLDLSMRITS